MNQNERIFYLPRPSRLIQYLKARMFPPEIKTKTVSEVLKGYGLELIEPPNNLPFGRRNRLVMVHTPAGKKVLKLYKKRWQVPTIIHEHSILNRLEQLRFSAPRLLATRDKATLVSLEGQHFALFDFVDGTSLNWTFVPRAHRRKLYAVAGKTLAELHCYLQGYLPAGEHHLGFRSYSGNRWRDLNWHINSLNRISEKSMSWSKPEEKIHLDWLVKNKNYIKDELYRLYENLSQATLPRSVIHGDYGVHNLQFHRNGRVTVHDFELARLEWRLIDLVAVLSRLDRERAHFFMKAYLSEYPLSAEEWDFLPQVWQFYKLEGAVQYWNTFFEVGGRYRLVSAKKRVNQAEWAARNRDELLKLKYITRE